jgi:hypothetical protein
LNCLYKCERNGALHCGHLFLTTIKVIRDCKWYMCWQVPKNHVLSCSNGEQQIRHSSPFCMKAWDVGHKNSFFFLTRQWHIPIWAWMCCPVYVPIFCIFNKLSIFFFKYARLWCQIVWLKFTIFIVFHLDFYKPTSIKNVLVIIKLQQLKSVTIWWWW